MSDDRRAQRWTLRVVCVSTALLLLNVAAALDNTARQLGLARDAAPRLEPARA